jgi:uncharacterized damage-inducible protein DinB
MNMPHSKTELIAQIREVEAALADTVAGLSAEQFDQDAPDAWSAAGYLKHMILSTKPFAKALALPREQMQSMFGQPDHASRNYEELVAAYKQRLDDGIRAEDFNAVTPVAYRLPEGTEDVQAYLLEVWHDAHNRLWQALENWSDEDLDRYQLPHPALGLITLREMLFFTLHHNTLHWHDIQQTQAA